MTFDRDNSPHYSFLVSLSETELERGAFVAALDEYCALHQIVEHEACSEVARRLAILVISGLRERTRLLLGLEAMRQEDVRRLDNLKATGERVREVARRRKA